MFKLILVVNGWGISCKTALIWVSLDRTYDKSTLVQVRAWYHQATSHYLSQCWPRSLSRYGVTRPQWGNSLWLRMHQWTKPSLHQIMTCHPFGTKPLSEPMLNYCSQLNPWEQIAVKFESKSEDLRKCIWKYRLQNVGHFVAAWMCWYDELSISWRWHPMETLSASPTLCAENVPDSNVHGAHMGPVGPMLSPWTLLSGVPVIQGPVSI